ESRAASFVRLMQGIVNAAMKRSPDALDTILRNMASAIGRLSPEMLVSLLSHAGEATSEAASVINSVVAKMSEQTIAGFIARNAQIWGSLMPPVVSLMEDLLLVGDLDAACDLGLVITAAVAPGANAERQQQAMIAVDTLISGSMMRHVITHIGKIDDQQFERL